MFGLKLVIVKENAKLEPVRLTVPLTAPNLGGGGAAPGGGGEGLSRTSGTTSFRVEPCVYTKAEPRGYSFMIFTDNDFDSMGVTEDEGLGYVVAKSKAGKYVYKLHVR